MKRVQPQNLGTNTRGVCKSKSQNTRSEKSIKQLTKNRSLNSVVIRMKNQAESRTASIQKAKKGTKQKDNQVRRYTYVEDKIKEQARLFKVTHVKS